MERINTPDERFHDGDPFNGVEGTLVTADWLNTVQEEIAAVIEQAGLTLDPVATNQLYQAINILLVSFAYSRAQSDARYLQTVATATTEQVGTVELATAEETRAGTDTTRAVTPAGLASVLGRARRYFHTGF